MSEVSIDKKFPAMLIFEEHRLNILTGKSFQRNSQDLIKSNDSPIYQLLGTVLICDHLSTETLSCLRVFLSILFFIIDLKKVEKTSILRRKPTDFLLVVTSAVVAII